MIFELRIDQEDKDWTQQFWRFVDMHEVNRRVTIGPDTRTRLDRLKAILEFLSGQGIRYHDEEPWRLPKGAGNQVVRDPEGVLDHREANCVEMVAVTAAACMNAAIRSWAVFGTRDGIGHAWLVADVGEGGRVTFEVSGGKKRGRTGEFEEWKNGRQRRPQEPRWALGIEQLSEAVSQSPDTYIVVDPVRLCVDYFEDGPGIVDGGADFMARYVLNGCCDIEWWWNSQWVSVSEASPGDSMPKSKRRIVAAGQRSSGRVVVNVNDERRVVARGGAGIELRPEQERSEGSIRVSSDGRLCAAVVDDAIEVAWIGPHKTELTRWEARKLRDCDSPAQVLAVAARGNFGALAIVSDPASTWFVEVDADGDARCRSIQEHPSTAAAIVRGKPWLLHDGRVEVPIERAFAPNTPVVDIDVAGSIGKEVLALLVVGELDFQVVVVDDPFGRSTTSVIKGIDGETTSVCLVRELDGTKPRAIQGAYGTGPGWERVLTWDEFNSAAEVGDGA